MRDRRVVLACRVATAGILSIALLMFSFAFFPRLGAQRGTLPPAENSAEEPPPTTPPASRSQEPEDPRFAGPRRRMVERDLAGRDITDRRVLEVMCRLRRQEFVLADDLDAAYSDRPLPIGHDQTISQPYIVALMTQLVRPRPNHRALDIGTGSGYQAAVLAELCKEVYSVEIVRPLADEARARLARLGYQNVTVRHGDGYQGWPEHAPFDVIVVAAAPDHVPQPLVEQLAPGGRLVIPVGRFFQELLLLEKQPDGQVTRRVVTAVAFVPMTGQAEQLDKP